MSFGNVIYAKKDLDMVEVRRYDGIHGVNHMWTFLGYDFVERKNGKIKSVFDSELEYEELKVATKIGNQVYHDYTGVNVDDIRVVHTDVCLIETTKFFGNEKYVSLSQIKAAMFNQPELSFLFYRRDKGVKGVEKIKSLFASK